MGARQDGRIEPGQRISRAISARAWNRAQDAADIVLGRQVRFGAGVPSSLPDRLYRRVTTAPSASRRMRFGMIVRERINGYQPFVTAIPGSLAEAAREIAHPLLYYFHAPPEFVNRRQVSSATFAIACSGEVPAKNAATYSETVVCTHGLCLAMVRKNPGGFLPRIMPAVRRYESDTNTNLIGLAEDSDCGAGELVRWTRICPFERQSQLDDGVPEDEIEELDDTLGSVFYALVRI